MVCPSIHTQKKTHRQHSVLVVVGAVMHDVFVPLQVSPNTVLHKVHNVVQQPIWKHDMQQPTDDSWGIAFKKTYPMNHASA